MADQIYGNLPSHWKTVSINDLIEDEQASLQTGPFGTMLHASSYKSEGTPVVAVQHIGNNRLLHIEMPHVDNETRQRLSRYELKTGDIIFGRKGAVDRRALVRNAEEGWLQGSDCIRLRLNDFKIDPVFVSYVLGSQIHREWIIQNAQGATMPSLNQEILRRIPLPLPPLHEQHAIAEILGALDDKIEVNRRMNATLESMARAVFRQWFVENEEVGNWEVGTVIQDFNLTMGQSPPGETYNEDGIGIPFFQGRADFEIRFPSNRVYCTAPTRFANPGDTLVCVRAPVGDLNMASEKCAIGRGVAAIRHKTGSRSYTYYTMHSLEENFKQFEAGGTVFGSINKIDFQNLKVVIPPSAIVEKFEECCFPLDQMIENNDKESRTLASLRDHLLPKLMRGEVRVKDVEV